MTALSTAMPNLVTISQMAAELLLFFVFQNGGRRHHGFGWILFSDHQQRLPDDLKLCLKFYVDPIYTLEGIAIVRFQLSVG